MSPFSSLGTFLTLSFLFPGIIIFSSLVLLVPESRVFIEHRSSIELIAIVLVISFLNGHFAFICERFALDYIWNRIYPAYRLLARRDIMIDRSRILASAEVSRITHMHFDTIFGEFILFTNTAFWMFLISSVKLFYIETVRDFEETGLLLCGAAITLVFTSPFFKHQYLSALEVLRDRVIQPLPPESIKAEDEELPLQGAMKIEGDTDNVYETHQPGIEIEPPSATYDV